jgi:hypothetical protein
MTTLQKIKGMKKSQDYMNNSFGDPYQVFVMANKNYVNQWTTVSLEDARKSIKLFFKETILPRNKAVIKNKNGKVIEVVENIK